MTISTKLFFLLFISFILTGNINAQKSCPEWSWVEKAGSPGKFSEAQGLSNTTDAAGNTYVTGYFSGTAYFGNTILTSTAGFDLFVAKLNINGEFQWAVKADGGSINDYSKGNGIAIDGSGNIYITGYFGGNVNFGSTKLSSTGNNAEILTAKLNSSGQWQWAVKASGTGNDISQSIVADASGNTFITGYFQGTTTFGTFDLTVSSGSSNMFVASLDNSGQFQWAVKGTGDIRPQSITSDASGNLYVTGYFYSSASFGNKSVYTSKRDAFIVKLDNKGLWQWAVNSASSVICQAFGIKSDALGNTYVTGFFNGTSNFGGTNLTTFGSDDIFVAKINTNGQWLWAVKAGGTSSDKGQSIAIDNSGFSYITGQYAGTASFGNINLSSSGNSFVAKLNSNGQWQSAYYSFANNSQSIAVDGSGNTYLTGYFQSSASFGNKNLNNQAGTYDIYVAKLNSTGQWQWSINVSKTSSITLINSTLDASGNSYITGYFQGIASFGNTTLSSDNYRDIFVAKLNSAGQYQWAIKAGGSTGDVQSITLDASNNIFITGYYNGAATFGSSNLNSISSTNDIFVAKLNNTGQWQWAVSAGGNSADIARGISVDANGNAYITGRFEGTTSFGTINLTSAGGGDLFVAKLNNSGQWTWAEKAGGSGYDQSYDLTLDALGNTIITGTFQGTASFGSTNLTTTNGIELFVAKINSNGQWQWAVQSNGGNTQATSITFDGSGNIYLTGYFNNKATFGSTSLTSAGGSDVFVAKLNSSGQWQWAVRAGSDYNSVSDMGTSIIADALGNSYITGTFSATTKPADFGNTNLTPTGGFYDYDVFIAKLNNSGQWQWALKAGGTKQDKGQGINIDASGNIYTTGNFYEKVSFGNTELTSPENSSLYIAKLNEVELIINAGNNQNITCGGNVKLNATGSGYKSFLWSPQSGLDNINILNPTATPITTTTYTITAINNCGHTSTSQVIVNVTPFPVNATANNTTINCGESTQLNATANVSGNVSYSWSPVTGLNNSKIENPIARPAYTTTYTVTATSSNGCTATSQVTITVNNPNPPAVGLTTSTGEKYFCNSGLTLSAGSGFASYKWNTGETTQSITPSQPGTYSVEIIDNGGCGNKDSISLIPLTKITAPDGPYLCADQPNPSVRLDAGAGFDNYEWNNGQQTQFLTVNTPGTYSVKVTKGSCVYTTSIQVMNHPGTTNAEFSYQSNGLKTQFTTLTQGVRFVDWNFGDGNNSSTINPEHIYSQPGTYNVCLELTDYCGATDKQCKSITVSAANSIEDVKKEENKINIYPNPATNHLVIEMKNSINSPIIITDITGRQVLNTINPLSHQLTIDISSLSGGLYFVNINQENYKFIKQ